MTFPVDIKLSFIFFFLRKMSKKLPIPDPSDARGIACALKIRQGFRGQLYAISITLYPSSTDNFPRLGVLKYTRQRLI